MLSISLLVKYLLTSLLVKQFQGIFYACFIADGFPFLQGISRDDTLHCSYFPIIRGSTSAMFG
jgi:hypothetical protein